MRFVVISQDKPDAEHLRLDNRAAHLAYIEETGVVELAGPFLDDDGQMCGSMLVLRVPNLQEARDWAASDPYAQAGLFQSVTVQPWKKVVG